MSEDRQPRIPAEYYWGERWRRLRQVTIADRRGRCEACGTTQHLHVHHLSYDRIGAEELDEIEVLCRDCHGRLHPARRKEWDEAAAARRWLDSWYASSEAAPPTDDLREAQQEVAEELEYWAQVDWSGESDDVYPDP